MKRWHHGEQAERWAALGLAQAEASFGRFAPPADLAALAKLLAMPPQPDAQASAA